MSTPPKARVRKALAYCIDGDRLLVLRHVDFGPEEVGIQVPGGSIRDGESPVAAALRELVEETGRTEFALVADLGMDAYDITPHRDEVQERHFVLFRPTAALPGRWSCEEAHDGVGAPTRLEAFWIPLARAHVLQAGQGQRLWKAVEVLGGLQPS